MNRRGFLGMLLALPAALLGWRQSQDSTLTPHDELGARWTPSATRWTQADDNPETWVRQDGLAVYVRHGLWSPCIRTRQRPNFYPSWHSFVWPTREEAIAELDAIFLLDDLMVRIVADAPWVPGTPGWTMANGRGFARRIEAFEQGLRRHLELKREAEMAIARLRAAEAVG